MATFVRFHSFAKALCEKKHNLSSDTLVLALCASASAPSQASSAVLADLTQISYTNLSSRTLSPSNSSTSGVYKLSATDLTLTASGGSVAAFRYVVLYNDTASNDELIGYWDYGSDQGLANGETFTVDYDGTEGILKVGA